MTKVLAFDPGSAKFGVAWAEGKLTPHWDNHAFSEHIGEDLYWFQKELRIYLHEICTHFDPELVVYETPLHYEHDAVLTTRKVDIFGGFLELYFGDKGIPVQESPIGRARKRFLGEGNVPRRRPEILDALMRECRRRGWMIENDDEANALVALEDARIEHGLIGTAMPLFEVESINPVFAGTAQPRGHLPVRRRQRKVGANV